MQAVRFVAEPCLPISRAHCCTVAIPTARYTLTVLMFRTVAEPCLPVSRTHCCVRLPPTRPITTAFDGGHMLTSANVCLRTRYIVVARVVVPMSQISTQNILPTRAPPFKQHWASTRQAATRSLLYRTHRAHAHLRTARRLEYVRFLGVPSEPLSACQPRRMIPMLNSMQP